MEPVNWVNLKAIGHPFLTALDPVMLLEGGQTFMRKYRDSRTHPKKTGLIIFDREYVKAFIKALVLAKLRVGTYTTVQDMRDLFDECMDEHIDELMMSGFGKAVTESEKTQSTLSAEVQETLVGYLNDQGGVNDLE